MMTISHTISEQIVSGRCGDFRLVEGGTLILYFGPANERHSFDKRIWIDCAWRLRTPESIKAGSLDDPSIILAEIEQIKGQIVDVVDVDEVSGDLRLAFHNGLMIETFGYSVADEHWEFRRSDGLRVGVGPMHQPFERLEDPD
jgi:hypothetical protein